MTPVRFSPSALREGRWYEYVIRFALGGAATVFTGLVSSGYGAFIGGLFLALPAIFCASATLIEKHEIRRKREASPASAGGKWRPRSTPPAPHSARGMLAFAVVFSLMADSSIAAAFMGASLAWLIISVAAWYVRRKMRPVRRVRTEQKGGGSAIPRSH